MSAHTCYTQVYDSSGWGSTHACGRKAKYERDGKHYCGTHDPVSVKAKADIRNAEWAKKNAKTSAESKIRNAAPDLLAALQAIVAEHGGTIGAGHDHPISIAARAAIAKATGAAA